MASPSSPLSPDRQQKPLVRFVGSTWRVGGLLALSRAFGDAYLKPTGEFEGFGSINADYSSGFGVEATPFVTVEDVSPDDKYLVLSSDGLYANEERGGGGGLQLDDVATMARAGAGGGRLRPPRFATYPAPPGYMCWLGGSLVLTRSARLPRSFLPQVLSSADSGATAKMLADEAVSAPSIPPKAISAAHAERVASALAGVG